MGFDEPILEPDLDGTLGHVDILCYPLSHRRRGCGVLIELHLKRHQLVLCGSLPLLVFLLLGERAFARRPTR